MTKDRIWIARHFGDFVKKYGGKYIAVVAQKVVAVDTSAKRVEEIAKKKYHVKTPSVVLVPRQEDLLHVLRKI